MDRRNMMLAALAAGGENATFTPAQVQKFFFLLDREATHLVGGPYFSFAAYDYGPFDREVYDELEALQAKGFVEIISSGRYRVYLLTTNGFAAGQRILATLPVPTQNFLKDTANWIRNLSFQQLVAAIYDRYPDMKANSIFRQ